VQWLLYLLTLVSGVLNPVQSGLTGTLEKSLDRPFLVAVISLGGSFACALVCAVVIPDALIVDSDVTLLGLLL